MTQRACPACIRVFKRHDTPWAARRREAEHDPCAAVRLRRPHPRNPRNPCSVSSPVTLRANLRKGKTLLNATNCPYYEIYFFEEASASAQFDAENDEIQCIITADIHWQIKPNQFPP